MQLPSDSRISEQYLRWSLEVQEYFQERAAIMEFMGHLTRADAEQKAYEETIRLLATKREQ